MFACNNDGKKSKDTQDLKSDTSAVSIKDTASVEVDSAAPVKVVSSIEGLPAGTKIVYVNLDSLQENYQYFVDENKSNTARLKQLESQMIVREKAILSTQNALQSRFQELQAKSQTMSPNDMKAAEIELQGKEQNLIKMQEDYQKFKEAKQEELLKKQEALNKKIKKRIDTYLEKVATDNSFDFILSYSDMTNPIMFGNKKLDITNQILKGLNEDYKAIKK